MLTYLLHSIPFVGAFAMFALGIAVIYRASRVLNLAHGAMATVPAYVLYTLVKLWHIPSVLGIPQVVEALPVAIAAGAILGVAVEFVFVRRLRPQGPTAQTVGTVAASGLLIALAAKVWGTTPAPPIPVFPQGVVLFPRAGIGPLQLFLPASGLRWGEIGLFFIGLIVSAGLFAFFRYTQVGLAMRGAAENRRAASLMGINPDLTASAAWALGGALAALSGVLLAAITVLDPYNLSFQVLPAFVAALIGGIESLPGALAGSGVVGLTYGLVPLFAQLPLIGRILSYSGASQLTLTVLAMVVMALRGRRFAGSESSEAGLATSGGLARFDRRRLTAMVAVAVPLLFLWWLKADFSLMGDSLIAIEYALVAISIVLLTGWVGQISLAQASFVGIAAFVTGMVGRGGLSFPANLIAAGAISSAVALVLGLVALRVRGLYLAVATMIFGWMADQFLFRGPLLGVEGGSSTLPAQSLGVQGGIPYFDFTDQRTLFVVMVAVLVVVVAALSNLKDTKTGRALFAVRGSEIAAASLGIDVMRYKLVAFALSGAIAGIGGNLLMVQQRTVVPDQFFLIVSLQFLSMAVVGGLGSLGGAIAAGVLFAALNEVFLSGLNLGFVHIAPQVFSGWLDVVSAGLLTLVLLAYPGGLAAVPSGAARLAGRLRAGLPERRRVALPGRTVAVGPAVRRPTPPVLLDGARRAATLLTRVRGEVQAMLGARPAGTNGNGAARTPARWRQALAPVLSRVPVRARPTVPRRPDDWFDALREETIAPVVATEAGPEGPAPAIAQASGESLSSLFALRSAGVGLDSRPRAEREVLLEASGITVRFGGLVAVRDASLRVHQGEVVGLIGPNGAGKTTLFNACLGLNSPTAGRVMLHGHDVTSLPPHLRARLGVARTFQVLQLFRELSVFDNVLVATHLHNDAGLVSNLAAGARTLRAEGAARARVHEILRLLDLDHLADKPVQGLPFGVLRMVELARAMVTGARLVLLDEPASGLNEAETDRLTEVVASMRALGVSVLLIEHDVRMVVGVSDYMYMLDRGELVAEGPPATVQRNPRVVAAYLGEEVLQTA
jgi:ABC-type branched-subunit amino acid transport system ATPase component/branched-subunit amino acid ABC-type transport system permease component